MPLVRFPSIEAGGINNASRQMIGAHQINRSTTEDAFARFSNAAVCKCIGKLGIVLNGGNHTGTAAVISPVGKLRYVEEVMDINGGQIGALSQRLYDTITGIQTGAIADEFGWRGNVSE